MTPDDIDKLTIAEVRAICERAEAALQTLRSLGMLPTVTTHATLNGQRISVPTSPIAIPSAPSTGAATSPFPCTACGRQFGFRGEDVLEKSCDVCGLPVPVAPAATNKGPLVWSDEEKALREMRRLEREGA